MKLGMLSCIKEICVKLYNDISSFYLDLGK